MRSALLKVKGVTQAVVAFERREAQVDYDPAQCSPNDLIAAVAKAGDPGMPMPFAAMIKK